MSLRQLANEVGCTESFLSKIENNKARRRWPYCTGS
jgi:transcriptional regulator with XRE-family HTH domain